MKKILGWCLFTLLPITLAIFSYINGRIKEVLGPFIAFGIIFISLWAGLILIGEWEKWN